MLSETESLDRYGLVLSDESGSQSLTCWGELGRRAARLEIGYYVLIRNISTFSHDNYLYLNVKQEEGGCFQVINSLSGLLHCPLLYKPLTFKQALAQKTSLFLVENVEIYQIYKEKTCQAVHTDCYKPLVKDYCHICQLQINRPEDKTWNFCFSVLLRDNTQSVRVIVSSIAAEVN